MLLWCPTASSMCSSCCCQVPGLHGLQRSGDPGAASVDYDVDSGSVVLTAGSALGCVCI